MNLGHGHYCVTSDGIVYSHGDANVNAQFEPFEFETGDTLHFVYDSTARKMIIEKENEGKKYEMFVEEIAAKDYAVCVYLLEKGDAIKLIDS